MAKRRLRVTQAFLFASLLVPVLHAADPALVGDVYISAAAPSTNFNTGASAQKLIVATGNTALIQFDLSAYPPGTAVSSLFAALPQHRDLRRYCQLRDRK